MLLLTKTVIKTVHANPNWTTYIPIIISAISLVLSLYSAISTYYEKHIKTKVYLRWCAKFGDQLSICLLISNMSSRPSTITDIQLELFKNTWREATWFPALLTTVGNKHSYSDYTPINIPPRSAKSVVVSFKQTPFSITTNQKVKLKYTVDEVTFERSECVKVTLNADDFSLAVQDRLR